MVHAPQLRDALSRAKDAKDGKGELRDEGIKETLWP